MGPSRAGVFCDVSDSVRFEVVLKLKGVTNESQDKDLSFLASKYKTSKWHTHVINFIATSNLCKLKGTFGNLAKSVEDTIYKLLMGHGQIAVDVYLVQVPLVWRI
jgi:hypothetical protein